MGIGLVAGVASLTVTGMLMKPKVTTSTARLDDIPPSVFRSSGATPDSVTPVDAADWGTGDLASDEDELRDDYTTPSSYVVASIGVEMKLSGHWSEIANQQTPFGTLVGFQRHDGGVPTVLTIAAVRPVLGMDDRMLETMVRSAIGEAQVAAGSKPTGITCAEVSRGQHCAGTVFEYKILGWAWAVNGRTYLVLAIIPMGQPNLYERMDEVFEVVKSIKPVGI